MWFQVGSATSFDDHQGLAFAQALTACVVAQRGWHRGQRAAEGTPTPPAAAAERLSRGGRLREVSSSGLQDEGVVVPGPSISW